MTTPADPPRVGDCLDRLPDARSALNFVPPVMAASTGPCASQNVGEIVFVARNVRSFPQKTENTLSQPATLACEPLIRAYLGWPAASFDGDDGAGTRWRPWGALTYGLVGPDLQQYFAGQRWLSCVAFPKFSPFRGSLAGSVRSGRAVDSYATCLISSSNPDVSAQSCSGAHQTEIFGWTSVSSPPGDLVSECADLVSRVTGMVEPTANGLLQIQVRRADGGMTLSDSGSRMAGDRLSCAVAVAGQWALTGSLIGIGDRPLPWS
jgi:hypothetical protein